MRLLAGDDQPDTGTITWGVTTNRAYMPKDLTPEFSDDSLDILSWLRQFVKSKEEDDNTFLRGFLGRMLFSGDEVLKATPVLSGGEKVRSYLAKLMLSKANVLLLDDPTNHLDLESITALNDALIDFTGAVIFTSHDHQFIQTIANHIIEVGPLGVVDRADMHYDDFLAHKVAQEQVAAIYPQD
jgi:ATPase subunit of ABC transporter with duplicated ATPase domains